MPPVKRFPRSPAHPERLCWGCDVYCPAHDLRCGNGSDRTQHPIEFLGADWFTVPGWDDVVAPALTSTSPPTSPQNSP